MHCATRALAALVHITVGIANLGTGLRGTLESRCRGEWIKDMRQNVAVADKGGAIWSSLVYLEFDCDTCIKDR